MFSESLEVGAQASERRRKRLIQFHFVDHRLGLIHSSVEAELALGGSEVLEFSEDFFLNLFLTKLENFISIHKNQEDNFVSLKYRRIVQITFKSSKGYSK